MTHLHSRADLHEHMDTHPLHGRELKRTLDFLSFTNRYFGGTKVVLSKLESYAPRWQRKTIHLLDVGTGAADIPIAIARWAAKYNHSIEITGIDLVPEIVEFAQKKAASWPNITIKQQDFFQLRAGEFDYVTASLMLHHAPMGKETDFLKQSDALAARGIIISDLERSRAGLYGVTAAAYTFGNKIVRHDGPVSVQRAFTIDELNSFAKKSGATYLSARREPWFRLSLSGEKIGAR